MLSQQFRLLIFRLSVLFLVTIVSVEIFFPSFKFPPVVKGMCIGGALSGLFITYKLFQQK